MSIYRTQLAEAVEAVQILSPTQYAWFDTRSTPMAAAAQGTNATAAHDYLLYTLQSRLYSHFYTQGGAAPEIPQPGLPTRPGMTPFVARLSAANAGIGHREAGWVVQAVHPNHRLSVVKDGLTIVVTPDRCVSKGALHPGKKVYLRAGKEHLGISPGFYMTYGNAVMTQARQEPLVRLYWHLTAEGAEVLIRLVTTVLNQAKLPFQCKVLADPERYQRCDAGVLYFPGGVYDRLMGHVAAIYREVRPFLRPAVPAFTRRMAPGLGLAEDPGEANTSFGMHRCRLVADGIIRAHEAGVSGLSDRIDFVSAHIEASGISMVAPYLNPGSPDRPAFQITASPASAEAEVASAAEFTADAPVAPEPAAPDREALMAAAVRLGQRLSETAIWYEDRCNWMGPQMAQQNRTHAALGPDLYSGSSGIAWFLAELYRLTGNEDFRRTALGAMRRSLTWTELNQPAGSAGFYTGQLGVGFAAAYTGRLLEHEEFWERGLRLVAGTRKPLESTAEFDLLSGVAGAIPALLALERMSGDPDHRTFAVDMGDRLIATGVRNGERLSWTWPMLPENYHLTGFSHGTAGAGYALLELSQATNDPRYRHAAEGAFAYERFWFDEQAQNWPDFRWERQAGDDDHHPRACQTVWCHGSAGIALSRLRAMRLLDDPVCRQEALTGLRTTARATERLLQRETSDFSLCHGLTGNAEALCYGTEVLGDSFAEGSRLSWSVATKGLALYDRRGLPYPCGVDDRESPTLMLGWAGIGRFYLRLCDPSLPSLLLLQPETFG